MRCGSPLQLPSRSRFARSAMDAAALVEIMRFGTAPGSEADLTQNRDLPKIGIKMFQHKNCARQAK